MDQRLSIQAGNTGVAKQNRPVAFSVTVVRLFKGGFVDQ